ncbi:MAG: hypothetical protein JHC61_06205 [Burkholderiaceae bacterium]|nr:hypothetical protein [Burkholderiaceae bacterium]
MAQILSEVLVAGVQWETLVGLEKESSEVRNLAVMREANHAVVLDSGQGARAVGLITLPDDDIGESRRAQPLRYALAPIVATFIVTRAAVFVHPDPSDAGQVLFITIRDGQPELDLSLPTSQALDHLLAFVNEVEDPIVAGVLPQEVATGSASDEAMDKAMDKASHTGVQTDTDAPACGSDDSISGVWPAIHTPITLDTCLRATRESDLTEFVFKRLQVHTQWKPILRKLAYPVVASGAVALCYYGWTVVDRALQPPPPMPVVANPIQLFQQQHRMVLRGEPLQFGAPHAKAVQQAIAALPLRPGGWRVESVACDLRACVATWQRGVGGTFDTLLAHRPSALVQGIDAAAEILALPTEVVGQAQVEPVPLGQFLKAAGSRLHELSDYGKTVEMSLPELLLPVPPPVAQREDIRPVSKGEWALQGDLAFMDSLPGLLARTGNMALVELNVLVHDDKPHYMAKGTYYVF